MTHWTTENPTEQSWSHRNGANREIGTRSPTWSQAVSWWCWGTESEKDSCSVSAHTLWKTPSCCDIIEPERDVMHVIDGPLMSNVFPVCVLGSFSRSSTRAFISHLWRGLITCSLRSPQRQNTKKKRKVVIQSQIFLSQPHNLKLTTVCSTYYPICVSSIQAAGPEISSVRRRMQSFTGLLFPCQPSVSYYPSPHTLGNYIWFDGCITLQSERPAITCHASPVMLFSEKFTNHRASCP